MPVTCKRYFIIDTSGYIHLTDRGRQNEASALSLCPNTSPYILHSCTCTSQWKSKHSMQSSIQVEYTSGRKWVLRFRQFDTHARTHACTHARAHAHTPAYTHARILVHTHWQTSMEGLRRHPQQQVSFEWYSPEQIADSFWPTLHITQNIN